MTAICGMLSWSCILFTYTRWRKGLKAQGIDRNTLPYRAPLQPYLSYCKHIHPSQQPLTNMTADGLSIAIMVLVFGGFGSFSKCSKPTLVHNISEVCQSIALIHRHSSRPTSRYLSSWFCWLDTSCCIAARRCHIGIWTSLLDSRWRSRWMRSDKVDGRSLRIMYDKRREKLESYSNRRKGGCWRRQRGGAALA